MISADLPDTLLNIFVFAFIGFLVWLYLKPTNSNDSGEDDDG